MRQYSFLWGAVLFWRPLFCSVNFILILIFKGLGTLPAVVYQQQRVCVHVRILYTFLHFFFQSSAFLTAAVHCRCGLSQSLHLCSSLKRVNVRVNMSSLFFNHIHKSLWCSSRLSACQFQQCPQYIHWPRLYLDKHSTAFLDGIFLAPGLTWRLDNFSRFPRLRPMRWHSCIL